MSEPSYRYTAKLAGEIEAHWQDHWETEGTFHAPNPAGPWAEPEKIDSRGEKLFVLDMFPYPSGAGLHVGHPLGYIATDTFARFNRMKGRNVLHALGYDAFGLPAEQYAVQSGQHPRVTTEHNIAIMRRQLRRLGLAHDPRRSVATVDVEFYRWTQWIFLQIFNAWFDEAANKARHIDELVEEFASGKRPTPSGRPWEELPAQERRQIIDSHRLAYLSEAPVNWCPGLGTVLANEEVTNEGRSEIGNFPVFKRNMSQWMLRITAYAERLLADLDKLDWPDKVKAMQRNWIGRSEGARVFFTEAASGERIEVFTTRPDTLFGATFMVLAPEHHLADGAASEWPEGTDPAWTGGHASPAEAVAAYRAEVERRTDADRSGDDKEKTGLFTGRFAINPVNGQRVPIFIADYVTLGYGTGAVMAVPSGDQRDWEFAKAYNLPIVETVIPCSEHDGNSAWTGDGEVINSANPEISLNGMNVSDAKTAITEWLEAKGLGEATVNYRLRDWLFSRQRYWGEPFPIVYDETGLPIALPEEMLPIELPEVTDYSPKAMDPEDRNSDPVPPLARATDWTSVELDLGDGKKVYRRELNVMPQWAGSCWYEMRYLDPANHDRFVGEEVERYWMGPRGEGDVGGVDLYVGGVEHAVLHLLYARFWHKVLFDLGFVSSAEPFRRLFNQGYIQAYAYRDSRGQTVPAAEVEAHGEGQEMTWTWQDQFVKREYGKMGKSLKNIVSPDEMYEAYGADTFRLYEMGMGPLAQSKPWETRAVVGSQRFLQRLWRNVVDEETGDLVTRDTDIDEATLHALHKTIDAVNKDYENLSFNTAIARLTEYNTVLTALKVVPRAAVEPLVLMVAPLAPHIAEELWHRLGHDQSLAHEPFPVADPELVAEDTITAVVQVRGKLRAQLEVSASITEDELRELALAHPRIVKEIPNGVRKVIVRAPKLVNVVPA
ncbi:leucine--tRNA ligase [Arachnia propionica]|uniref:Leucine--tRNA ligase n=1 Tax=Arachnia propionica TaxID=1750 RepID=A0AB37I7C6_9ACTN|nr:leucine--tRNA ligase [Arachnia propionica]AFN45946.1 leucine--tRNA ligase [Arachnia propionica F0230a]QCT38228.1 leucine--tRNA ligase [Arachnia propionica]QUC12187.1 leucine--tRNA ligase [Arachnia propionica]RPA18989.1 leucine--tRNA ligase [Arachnia propionica]